MESSSQSTYTRTELVWPGKRTQVERIALPFQVVETINQSRATREQTPMLAGLPSPPLFEGQSTSDTEWTNKLIWGENKYVMASLLQGDPSIGLEPLAGKINLIYIDPPFATGQDFSYRARVGDEEWLKEASIIEEVAYRDTWGRGLDSYLQMLYERLVLMKSLLSDTGSIYVHLDYHVGHYVKAMMDELFGEDNFRNEVTWRRQIVRGMKTHARFMPFSADSILIYTKSESAVWNPIEKEVLITLEEAERKYMKDARGYFRTSDPGTYSDESLIKLHEEGRIYVSDGGKPIIQNGKVSTTRGTIGVKYYREQRGQFVVEKSIADNIWDDIPGMGIVSAQYLRFPTQKPEALLERIIKASSKDPKESLRNGETIPLVADFFCGSGTTMAVAESLGRRWIGCDLSRYAIQVSRKRLLDILDCKPFQVLNLGKYERKHWQVNVLNGQQEDGSQAIADYFRFIVALYHAETVGSYAHLHGQKAGRWVHVGAVDAPVTRAEIMDAVRECQAYHYTGLDVLGWEWEMGLHDTVRDEARRMGIDLRLLYIPREVMDRRAVQAGDVHFYELAYLKTALLPEGRTVTVKLEDFIIPNLDLVPEEVRRKIKRWSDYIDFWAVDWNYNGDAFHNEWQTYRTRKSPSLRLISDPHTYQEPGSYRILVKVIDIFGNDTTQLLQANVP